MVSHITMGVLEANSIPKMHNTTNIDNINFIDVVPASLLLTLNMFHKLSRT